MRNVAPGGPNGKGVLMTVVASQVPVGAAHFPMDYTGAPQSYAFLLVPGFTLLAFASALEPLRIANQLVQKPLFEWRVLSESGQPVHSSSGVPVGVDGPLSSLGKDARLLVCAGNHQMAAASPGIVAAVQRHHRFGGTVGGICTGAVALAKAGLVEDRRFTLHWENQPSFVEDFPHLTPSLNRFEIDGKVLTCGGGAASTDMMVSIIASEFGSDLASMVSDMCLRTVMSDAGLGQRSSLAVLMSSRNPAVIAAVGLMNRHIEDPLTMRDLSQQVGRTSRQLERLFKELTGSTPADFYRGLRLDRARNLLSTTNMTLIEIATACGFSATSHFTKCFRARYGTTPSKLKQAVGQAR